MFALVLIVQLFDLIRVPQLFVISLSKKNWRFAHWEGEYFIREILKQEQRIFAKIAQILLKQYCIVDVQINLIKLEGFFLLQLMDIRLTLAKCSSAIKELRQLHEQLSTLSSCINETRWDSLMREVNDKKVCAKNIFTQYH